MMNILEVFNDVLWSYVLIIALIGCGLWFSYKTKFVQFRMMGRMFKLLVEKENADKTERTEIFEIAEKAEEAERAERAEKTSKSKNSKTKEKKISSFQAFTVSLASRVGTGNLAGVATAIAIGGAGAIFWMWLIALIGSASAFVESTLAQLYKVKGKDSYIGGPAYYIEKGLKKRWFGVLFAGLITITFGFAFNSVQSNTLSAAFEKAYGLEPYIMGIILMILTLSIIFGGIQRVAKVSSVIVPIMAIGYILLSFYVVIIKIDELPKVLELIMANAMGIEQIAAGGVGAMIMQGIKRGLFSNEAGMGSAPNAAATAEVSHPVKQGLIQTLGVFTDTILICSCTAFIILLSGANIDGTLNGIQLTQQALINEVGLWGADFIAIALVFLAFSSILGNYYYGEANIRYITSNKKILFTYRLLVGLIVMIGAISNLTLIWTVADIFMGLMALCNLVAIMILGKYAYRLLTDYRNQLNKGIKSPVFKKETMPDIADDLECW